MNLMIEIRMEWMNERKYEILPNVFFLVWCLFSCYCLEILQPWNDLGVCQGQRFHCAKGRRERWKRWVQGWLLRQRSWPSPTWPTIQGTTSRTSAWTSKQVCLTLLLASWGLGWKLLQVEMWPQNSNCAKLVLINFGRQYSLVIMEETQSFVMWFQGLACGSSWKWNLDDPVLAWFLLYH